MTARPAIVPILLLAAVAAVLCAPRAIAAPAAGKSLGVVYADGRGTEDVALASLEKGSDELFVSAYDLARIFKATKFWNAGNRKLVLRIGNHRYMFTIDARVVVVDETPVLLRLNVRYDEGAVWIPLEFITGVLASRMAEKISLDTGRLLLSIGSPEYNVTAIEIVDDKDGTRAVLKLTEELLYHIDSEGKGLLNRVRAEQMEHDAYLFFDVKKTVRRYRVEFEAAGAAEGAAGAPGESRKLVLFLERGKLPEIPEVDFAGKKMVEMLDEGARRKIIEPVRTIALDPGHGGPDIGKIGPSGAREKDLNLQIALMLRDRLVEELGIAVVMTRTEDVLVPFDQRVETANAAGAQLFISIHCNGWFTSDAEGFEVIFLAPARTEDEARLARDENSSAAYENQASGGDAGNDIDFILWDVVQNEYLNESSDLAELIQREWSTTLGIRNRGVKQTGLRVLKGLAMPGVLVETAFLSNPKEEKLLLGAEFKEKIVEGTIEAVRKFQSRYGESRTKPAGE